MHSSGCPEAGSPGPEAAGAGNTLGGVTAAAAPFRHPHDGPDLDLRLRLEEGRLLWTVVLNLAFVDLVAPRPRAREESLSEEEREALRPLLEARLAEGVRVLADGRAALPRFRPPVFEAADPLLLPLFPATGARALARLRLVLEFPLEEAPSRLVLGWGLWPEVPAGEPAPPAELLAPFTTDGGELLLRFSADTPEAVWEEGRLPAPAFRPLPGAAGGSRRGLPLLSLGVLLAAGGLGLWARRRLAPAASRRALLLGLPLALGLAAGLRGRALLPLGGPELPGEAEAQAIFEALLHNLYRAFDFTSEEQIWDALARSVEPGPLLDRLYASIHHALILEEEGGAAARVRAVRPVELRVGERGLLEPGGRPGFRVLARWQVDAAVLHWGHTHFRTWEYRARFTVQETAAGWRLTDQELLGETRVDAAAGGGGGGR